MVLGRAEGRGAVLDALDRASGGAPLRVPEHALARTRAARVELPGPASQVRIDGEFGFELVPDGADPSAPVVLEVWPEALSVLLPREAG